MNRKNPKADLRKNYRIFLELGLIAVLLICIAAFKIEFRAGQTNLDKYTKEQEVVKMKKVVRTQQQKQPPPPPKPQVPVEVPNEKVLTDQNIQLDADFDLNEPLTPPQPPQPDNGEGAQEKVFMAVQHMPQLKNKKDFYAGVEYPRSCRIAGIEGTVYVSFVVTGTGEVTNAKVIRGIGGGCDEYALNYVLNNANFSPGRQRGKPVSVQYTLPILFNLR